MPSGGAATGAQLRDPVDFAVTQVGRRAAAMLLERFGGVSLPPRRIILNSKVVLRNSVGARKPVRHPVLSDLR